MVVCNSSHLLFSCYGFGLYCECRKLSIVMQNLRVISLFKLWERFYLLSFINYRTDWTVLLWIYYEWMRTLRSVGQAQETASNTACHVAHSLRRPSSLGSLHDAHRSRSSGAGASYQSISSCSKPAARVHVAAAYWLLIDGTDGRAFDRYIDAYHVPCSQRYRHSWMRISHMPMAT